MKYEKGFFNQPHLVRHLDKQWQVCTLGPCKEIYLALPSAVEIHICMIVRLSHSWLVSLSYYTSGFTNCYLYHNSIPIFSPFHRFIPNSRGDLILCLFLVSLSFPFHQNLSRQRGRLIHFVCVPVKFPFITSNCKFDFLCFKIILEFWFLERERTFFFWASNKCLSRSADAARENKNDKNGWFSVK